MKKSHFLFLITAILLCFASCSKNDNDTTVPTVSLSVAMSYSADDSALGLSKENINITLTNLLSGQSYKISTNANGAATFGNIAPGRYTVTAAKTYTADSFYLVTNVSTGVDVSYNASTTEDVYETKTLQLKLVSGKVGDLVFKQLYYAGSNTSTGAAFRDVFVEIYNNSNDTIYLDSLYIGNTFSNNKKLTDVSGLGKNSFDWNNSIGITGTGDLNKDYLYFRYLFRIPGTGKQHPLEPGQSIVVAATAINHAKPYTDNSGKTQGITNPELTVDLSGAAFEAYLVNYRQSIYTGTTAFTPYRWDIDNPLVPNLDVLISNGQEWTFDAPGREDFVMFRSSSDATKWNAYPDPTAATIVSSTNSGLQVYKPNVLDAVEILTPNVDDRTAKRLPINLDAAGTFVAGGQYSSQSLIRKTAKTVNGRRILMDTNNSAEDFSTKAKADPSKSDASFTTK